MDTDRVWYLPGPRNEPAGPFSTHEVLARLLARRVDETTLCWCEGMSQWAPLGQVEPFAATVALAARELTEEGLLNREGALSLALECPNCHGSVATEQSSGSPGGLQCPHCGSTVPVFDQNTLVVSDRSHVASSAALIDLHIEGYEILDTLGEGGMGIVYAGRQLSLDRRVAIKVLSPLLAKAPNFLARFEREIAILVRLSHPHIVAIFDQGRSPTGHVYYVMEYVEGESGGPPKDLQRLISDRSLDSERTRELILQVVQALGFAHREGIVHRDVKPTNVLIDRHGFAKVADFGIAGIRTGHQAQHLTMANTSVGTMIYMSPEQHQDAASVDHRTDIYSTGVVLYQMLTGELPFPGYELPSRLVPGLSPRWDAIIAKALQPKPESRFADMAEFEEALKSLEQTPAVRPDSGLGTQAGAEQATSATSPPMTCAQCGVGVSENDQFCLQCGASVWVDCRQCGKRVFAGARFCPTCRADVQSVRLFEEHLQLGKGCFEKAKGQPRLVERVRRLEQARLTLAKALNYMDDPDARSLLDEANRLAGEFAWEAGETAFHTRRFGEALYCYEQVLEVLPEHVGANARVEKIRAHRADLVNRARRLFEEGNLKKAIDLLGTAARSFAGDEEIAGLLAEYGEKTQCLKELQARIATLAKENKWCEVSQLVADLQQSGIPIKGLDEYAARVQEKLKLVEPLVAAARLSLDKGDPAQARARAHQVLEQISDHLEAMEIAELARAQPAPRRWGRRLVSLLVGLACLVAVGAIGYFEIAELLDLRKAEQRIDQGDYNGASGALKELGNTPYHALLGGYFHDRKAKYLMAVAGIKAYASGKQGPDCASFPTSTELLKQALGDSDKWHQRAEKRLGGTGGFIPAQATDAAERTLAVARALHGLKVHDGKHWAKVLFEKTKEIRGLGDGPIDDGKYVKLILQILDWDRSSAEDVVGLLLPEEAPTPNGLQLGLAVLQDVAQKGPSLAPPLTAAMLQRGDRCVDARKYDHASKVMETVAAIAPSSVDKIIGQLERATNKCAGHRDVQGGVQMLNCIVRIDENRARRAAEIYVSSYKPASELDLPANLDSRIARYVSEILASQEFDALMSQAQHEMKKGDYGKAKSTLERARAKCSPERKEEWQKLYVEACYGDCLNAAREAFGKGDWETAKDKAREAMVIVDKSAHLDGSEAKQFLADIADQYQAKGEKAFQAGEQKKAEGDLVAAKKEFQRAREAYDETVKTNRVIDKIDKNIEEKLNHIDQELRDIDRALEEKEIQAYLAHGKQWALKKRWTKALEKVQEALDIRSDHQDALSLQKEYREKQNDRNTTDLSGVWRSPSGGLWELEGDDKAITVEAIELPSHGDFKSCSGRWQRKGTHLVGKFSVVFTQYTAARVFTGTVHANIKDAKTLSVGRKKTKIPDPRKPEFKASGYIDFTKQIH